LFSEWSAPGTSCFVYLGSCKKDKEVLFLRMLSLMPVDVLILTPNLNEAASIEDKRLQVVFHIGSIVLEHFPRDARNIKITEKTDIALMEQMLKEEM
jgi:hypothetical protein